MKDYLYSNLQRLEKQVERFHWEEPEVYREFLAQTFHYVSHSTRLLAYAASRLPLGAEKLFNRFTAHIAEERSHELLAKRDLNTLGREVLDFQELSITAALYRTQYDSIEREESVALLGYILALEGISTTKMKSVYERLSQVYPRSATSFIQLHAQEDPDHLDDAFRALEGLNLRQLELISRNVKWTVDLYGLMLEEIQIHALAKPVSISPPTKKSQQASSVTMI